MSRFLAILTGTVTLGWLAGIATADEPAADQPAAAEKIDVTVERAPAAGEIVSVPKEPIVLKDGHSPVLSGHDVGPECSGVRILAGASAMYLTPDLDRNPAYYLNPNDGLLGAGQFQVPLNLQGFMFGAFNGTPNRVLFALPGQPGGPGGFQLANPVLAGNGPASLNAVPGTNATDFEWDYEWSPRLWLGAISPDGVGFRARGWMFEHGSDTSLTNPAVSGPGNNYSANFPVIASADPFGSGLAIGSPGFLTTPGAILFVPLGDVTFFPAISPGIGADQLAFESDLDMEVYDLEAVWEVQGDGYSMLLSAGLRYAHLAQSYNATRFHPGATYIDPFLASFGLSFINDIDQELEILRSGHNFSGIGPTAAIEARSAVGESGLAVYGSLRGSVLFGEARRQANLFSTMTGMLQLDATTFAPFDFTFTDSFSDSFDDSVPSFEMELGAEYGVSLGSTRAVIQAGLVTHYWPSFGSAANSTGDLTLYGFTINAGLSY